MWPLPHALRFLVILWVLSAGAACGPSGSVLPGDGDGGIPRTDGARTDGAPPGPHELAFIVIDPLNAILELDLGSGGSITYTARGQYKDGTSEDLTGQVVWSHTNEPLGAFTGNTLNIEPQSTVGAWLTTVEARVGVLKGIAQLTVVSYRKTGNQTDFFFVLPHTQDPSQTQEKPLDFHTNIRSLDVFFLMDTTGSMYGEISNLQTSLNTIISQIQAEIPDTWFGAGHYEDFPDSPTFQYGAAHGYDCNRGGRAEPDQPFELFQPVTANAAAVQTAVNRMANGVNQPIGCGADTPESLIEALYQTATGEGLSGPPLTSVAANHNGVGGVEYRKGSMPVVVPVTDSMSHAPGENRICQVTGESSAYAGAVAQVAHTRQQTKDALSSICAKVVGIASIEPAIATCTGLEDEEDFARATGAKVPPTVWDGARPAGCGDGQCCTGIGGAGRAPDADGLCPLVFMINANGTGLGTSVITGLKMLTRYAKFDVKTEIVGNPQGDNGEPLPTGYTTAAFIKEIVPVDSTPPPPPPTLPKAVIVGNEFNDVYPGSVVSFTVRALNDFVPQTEQPQFFRAVIKVLAGGCTDLDQREVLILVPPKDITIG